MRLIKIWNTERKDKKTVELISYFSTSFTPGIKLDKSKKTIYHNEIYEH